MTTMIITILQGPDQSLRILIALRFLILFLGGLGITFKIYFLVGIPSLTEEVSENVVVVTGEGGAPGY